jgi:hypothetical protein
VDIWSGGIIMAEHVSREAMQTISVVSCRVIASIWLVCFQCFGSSSIAIVECLN